MRVILAGFNVDREILSGLHGLLEQIYRRIEMQDKTGEPVSFPEELRIACREMLQADNITPETLSAAYARISRDPRPVDLLREEARNWVSKSRRSNRNIVFGLGHASVAEHAVFNVDIIGVSRYVVEMIQMHRMCSFTEKSQRYIRLGKDFVIPEEAASAGIRDSFERFVLQQFQRYEYAVQQIAGLLGRDPAEAGEDARYFLPLCVTTQSGMTVNARSLEYVLQCAASSPLKEYNEFGRLLFQITDGIAPSVIKYTEGTDSLRNTYSTLHSLLSEWRSEAGSMSENGPVPIRLQSITSEGDMQILKAIMVRLTGCSMDNAADRLAGLDPDRRRSLFLSIFRELQPWDSVPREFELADATFEIVISAAAFGQLKRHRMMSLVASSYDESLGLTVPPVFEDAKLAGLLQQSADDCQKWIHWFENVAPEAAGYAVLGGHRRRVIAKLNIRELIHLTRLRQDVHAQWDIRTITGQMVDLIKPHMPFSAMFMCGKHQFSEKMHSLFPDRPDVF